MKLPVEIKARARDSVWAMGIVLSLIVLPGFALSGFRSTPLLFSFLGTWIAALISLGAWVEMRQGRIKNRGAVLTEVGIGPTLDGEPVWILPWSRFGGYRSAASSDWRRLWHPEDDGIEVLDTEGKAVGLLNVHPDAPVVAWGQLRAAGRRANNEFFWKELEIRVPEGGPKVTRSQSWTNRPFTLKGSRIRRKLVRAVALTPLAIGLTTLMVMAMGTEQPASWQLYFGKPLAILAVIGFLTFALYEGATGLLGIAYLKEEREKALIVAPTDGPAYAEFLAAHDGLPKETALIEGVRYIPVDRQNRKRTLRQGVNTGLLGLGTFGTFYCGAAFLGPWMFLFFSVFYVPMIVLSYLAWRLCKEALASIDDTVIPVDGGLVVVKPDGAHLSFSDRAIVKAAPWWISKVFGSHEIWTEGPHRYFLDRPHLVPSRVQLDHPDVKSLLEGKATRDSEVPDA